MICGFRYSNVILWLLIIDFVCHAYRSTSTKIQLDLLCNFVSIFFSMKSRKVYDRSQEWTEENRSFPTTSSDSSAAVQDAKEVKKAFSF